MEKIAKVISAISAVLLSIGPFYIFGVCDHEEKIMKCTYTCRIEAMIGITILCVLLLFIASKDSTLKLYLICLLNWVEAIAVPLYIIGGCADRYMKCNVVTFPCIYLICVINIVLDIIIIIRKVLKNRNRNDIS